MCPDVSFDEMLEKNRKNSHYYKKYWDLRGKSIFGHSQQRTNRELSCKKVDSKNKRNDKRTVLP